MKKYKRSRIRSRAFAVLDASCGLGVKRARNGEGFVSCSEDMSVLVDERAMSVVIDGGAVMRDIERSSSLRIVGEGKNMTGGLLCSWGWMTLNLYIRQGKEGLIRLEGPS